MEARSGRSEGPAGLFAGGGLRREAARGSIVHGSSASTLLREH